MGSWNFEDRVENGFGGQHVAKFPLHFGTARIYFDLAVAVDEKAHDGYLRVAHFGENPFVTLGSLQRRFGVLFVIVFDFRKV